MVKTIIKYVVVALVAGVIGYAVHGGSSFAGISHLSGLAVGADGLFTENGGVASFGTTLAVGTTLTVGGATTTSNGVADITRHEVMAGNAASTTPVRILSHPTASSTLESLVCNATVSSTTAAVWGISKSTSGYSTSTNILATTTVGANGQFTLNAKATTTVAADFGQVMSALVFAPGQSAVLWATGGVGTFSPVGTCNGVFRAVN